jgi:hypothetical protein
VARAEAAEARLAEAERVLRALYEACQEAEATGTMVERAPVLLAGAYLDYREQPHERQDRTGLTFEYDEKDVRVLDGEALASREQEDRNCPHEYDLIRTECVLCGHDPREQEDQP